MTVMGSFAVLMAVSVVMTFFIGREEIIKYVRFSLTNFNDCVIDKMEYIYVSGIRYYADLIDNTMQDELDYLKSPEFSEGLYGNVHNFESESEINFVDHDGVIIASSDSKNIGLDLNSCPEAEEFLKLTDGDPNYVLGSMKLRESDTEPMLYCGVPLPKCGIFVLCARDRELSDKRKEYSLVVTIKDINIGKTGYYLCLNSDGEIVGSPGDVHNGEQSGLPWDVKELSESGKVESGEVYGVMSYAAAMADGDRYLVAVYPVLEAWDSWLVLMIVTVLIYIVVFFILFLMIRHLMTVQVVRGVYSLNGSLNRITEGNLDERADFRNSIEFDELSDGINQTVDKLKELISEAEGRIDAELALAATIQCSILPHEFPPFPDRSEFELYAYMIPAKEVGGDFYDFFLTDPDHLALVMGDVSGKGIPAAMFMAEAKNRLRHIVMRYGSDVARAVSELNADLSEENGAGLFVTLWLGVLTVSTGHVDYVDAGHEYPALSLGGGEFRVEKDTHSISVAMRKKAVFSAGSFDLNPGDILYLYTDGIVEAHNPEGKMFRISGMLEALNRDRNASVDSIDRNVREKLAEFVKDAPPFDDATTLVLRYKGVQA